MTDPHPSDSTDVDSRSVHHETSDVNIRAIFGFGLGLAIAAAFLHAFVLLLFGYFSSREARHPAPDFPLAAAQENRVPPEPRLQTNPRQDLLDLRAQEDRVLSTYGWIDKSRGVVRIPIDEAMKLTVERGLPARQENDVRR